MRPDLTILLPLKKHAEQNGITLNSFVTLVAVGDETRSHSTIAELIGTSQASVTSIVDRLVAANCVSSTPSIGDRRVKNVTLTDRGKSILQTAPKAA